MEKNVLQTSLDIKKAIFKNHKIEGFYSVGNIVNNIIYSYENNINEIVLCSFYDDLIVNGISVADIFGYNHKSIHYDFFHLLLGHSFYKHLVQSLLSNEKIKHNNINLYFSTTEYKGKIQYKIKISKRVKFNYYYKN